MGAHKAKKAPLNLSQITAPLGDLFRFAAMICAGLAVLKMTGLVSVRFAVTELAACAVALALAK